MAVKILLPLWCFIFLFSDIYCIRKKFRNNVCKSFVAYNYKDVSSKCQHDPDADVNIDMGSIVTHHTGESAKVYEVTTEDGYILTVFRIPRDNAKCVVWLQHPVAVDAIVWVSQSNLSLAFLLYEAGCDVWLPSQRGTTLSRGHVTLTTKDFEYWNFTFHEIGIYDFKAFNKLIVEKTNRTDIIFIGHSTGSASSLIYASMYPEEARNNVKVFINMASPVFFKHIPFYIKALVPLEIILNPITKFLRIGPILRYENRFYRVVFPLSKYFPFNSIAYIALDFISGYTFGEQDPLYIGLLFDKLPRGFSLKLLYHFAQLAQTNSKFQLFNYRNKNKEVYGTRHPPEYPLEKITAPFYFIYSDSDVLATEKDNEELFRRLPEKVKYGKHKLEHINHVDYFVGKDMKTKIYDPIIDMIVNKL